ncbi:unnamed protein product [Ectocarpus sp. 12 AP-2014]
MLAARSSVAAAFSSSSLSLAASADTSSVLHLSTPRLVARSPSLLKANRGVADASAIRGPGPPCVFTLRGKGQRRGQGGESNGRSATTNVSPRRVIRVETGEGYSPRLRMMGAEGCIDGDVMTRTKTAAAVPPSSTVFDPRSKSSPPASPSAAASTGRERAESGDIAAMTYNRASSPYPCRQDTAPREREEDLPPEAAAGVTMDVEGNPARVSRRSASHPRERPRTPPRKGYLCGRLWTGTTASPKSDEVRPRVLFLVSGQQQRLKEAARTKHSVRGREEEQCRVHPVVVPLPPPAGAKKTPVRATRTRSSTRRAAGSRVRRRSNSCDDGDGGQAGEVREDMSAPGSTGGPEGDDESYEGVTTAATDGKGDSSGRMVLHVRVPRPPPTSLLVLRSAPPST